MLALLALLAPPPDTITLSPGLVITRSVVVRPGTYRLAPRLPDSAVIRIRGSNLEVDLRGVELRGTEPGTAPDQASGIGVLIEGGRDITVRGARIRGYRIGILARAVTRLRLVENDVSHNWRPRLWSGLGHESLVDWLSFHHNERDEWLRYGAGIFLVDVQNGEVRGNRAVHGMNGLLMVRTESTRIWENEFSFLSGLGIGLYRSSGNTVMHNRLDWCVRGHVHGGYRRGQDSAALLLYEQSSDNIVAYNSMTHGGDGLFLWAGQSTMDTGAGGANDNLFFGNDVSFAVTNGLEATFSRNRFIGNRIEGADHGLWGGYSWESEVRGNWFSDNRIGIAIEHGQDNLIVSNRFERDTTAIRLWSNPIEPSDWGYPRRRDTRSRDYQIVSNRFLGHRVAVRVENTRGLTLRENRFAAVDTVLSATGDTTGSRIGSLAGPGAAGSPPEVRRWVPDLRDPAAPRPMTAQIQRWLERPARSGRDAILIDEWGPYDWRSPRLWPARLADSAWTGGPLTFRVLGPPGRWRVIGGHGVALVSDSSGVVGDTLRVTPVPGPVADWELALEYRGGAVVTPDGDSTPSGAPYRFRAARFAAPIEWKVAVFPWDSASDPRSRPGGFRALLAGAPALTRRDRALDYLWHRPRLPGFPAERFAVVAEGEVTLPEGEYELLAISDDGIRVWADGQLVIDHWAPHESAVARAPLVPGRRQLRVEYYQVDGWLELRVEVRRRT